MNYLQDTKISGIEIFVSIANASRQNTHLRGVAI